MLLRKEKNEALTMRLSAFSVFISASGMQYMFDNNRIMEKVLTTLLNDLYGWSLIDLNLERANYPALDLGDRDIGLAVQVTADGSRYKKRQTIEMYERHNLNETYNTIVFLAISGQTNSKIANPYPNYTFQYLNLILIAKDICELENEDKFEKIYSYCMSQFKDPFEASGQRSALEPQYVPSISATSLDDFFIANGIEFDSNDLDYGGKARSEYFDEINKLNNELADLSDNERWLIYLTMKWSIKYYSNRNNRFVESCFAPLTYFENHFGNEKRSIVKNAIDHLEQLDLLVNNSEGVASFDFPHIALTFSGKDKELNYFVLICQYFKDQYDSDEERYFYLKDTITNCNFLNIT